MPWTGGTGRREAALRGVGSELAPLVYRFVQWVAESAAGAGHATVFYMSREGEFLATVHARLRELGAVPPRVAPRVLEVSRLGTVGMLRRAPAAADWSQLWWLCCDQQYGPREVGAMLGALGIDAASVPNALSRVGLDAAEEVVRPWADARVARLIELPEFRSVVERRVTEQRALFARYCAARGLTPDLPAAAVADVGWRGSVQGALAVLFPETRLDGYYLGLRELADPQRANVRRFAYGPDANAGPPRDAVLLDYIAPYEMVLSSGTPPVVGYRLERGVPVAERRGSPRDQWWHGEFIRPVQDGIRDGLTGVHERHQRSGSDERRLDAEARRLLFRLAFEPPRALGRAFLATYDQPWGHGRLAPLRRPLPWRLMLRAALSPRGTEPLEAWLDRTPWPAGYCCGRGARWLLARLTRKRVLSAPPRRRLLADGALADGALADGALADETT